MKYKIKYARAVGKTDIPRLSKTNAKIILAVIDKKLTRNPKVFGKPLKYTLSGARSLRVGNYRVLYIIQGRTVQIFGIRHRSRAYKVFFQ